MYPVRQRDNNNVHTHRYQDPSTIYVQVPSISQNNNNNNIFHATRRDQQHKHAPTLQAPAPLIKKRGYQHIDGSVPKTTYGTSHKPNPYRITSSIQNPESHKAKSHLPQKKMPPHNQPGGKRGGENLLGGYDERTRTRSQRSFWWCWWRQGGWDLTGSFLLGG